MPDYVSSFKGATAVAGIGSSPFYKRGQSGCEPVQLALQAILAACEDAGIEPNSVDGFASFSNESVDPVRLAAALNVKNLRHSSLFWGGGGGGVCGAIEQAANAIIAGRAERVVVFRSIAQPDDKRYGQGGGYGDMNDGARMLIPYGVLSPAQYFAVKIQRFFVDHAIDPELMWEIAQISNIHAQANPYAVRYGRPLSRDEYDNSRRIAEPLCLYDCCLETDSAAAVILCRADKAPEQRHPPVLLLSAVSGSDGLAGASLHNAPDFASSNLQSIAKRLFVEAAISPAQIDVLQCYENFTGAVIMSIIESGFCRPQQAGEFFTKENLGLNGSLPLNTSGGHLGEAYVQGMGLVVEAARQVRGTSCNQVDSVNYSMVAGGPLIAPVSACIFGSKDAL